MRRITLWLAATLAVVAMASYYQVSLSGDGKDDTRPAAAQSGDSEQDDGRAGGTESEQSGKPGESKSE